MENAENKAEGKKDDASQRTLMGILSYIGPLVLVPHFTVKDDSFVKFHVKQGFVVLAIEVVAWFFGNMTMIFWPIIGLVNLGSLVLSIIGIVNVVNKKEKPLPLVGDFAKYVKF